MSELQMEMIPQKFIHRDPAAIHLDALGSGANLERPLRSFAISSDAASSCRSLSFRLVEKADGQAADELVAARARA